MSSYEDHKKEKTAKFTSAKDRVIAIADALPAYLNSLQTKLEEWKTAVIMLVKMELAKRDSADAIMLRILNDVIKDRVRKSGTDIDYAWYVEQFQKVEHNTTKYLGKIGQVIDELNRANIAEQQIRDKAAEMIELPDMPQPPTN